MYRYFTAFLTIIVVLYNFSIAEAKLTLQEVRTASRDVQVAFFTSDTLNLNEVNIENKAEWRINGQPVDTLYRYITQADLFDHHIYLQTTPLLEGNHYVLETPYGKKEFQFKERDIFCESIKANQAGYSALSKIRYANFAVWLGTGGTQKIEGDLP